MYRGKLAASCVHLLACLLLTPFAAAAQDEDLSAAVRVVQAGDANVQVVATIRNHGTFSATGMRIALWPQHEAAIEVLAALLPEQTIERRWSLSAGEWQTRYRRVAAIRLDYKGANGRAQSRVATAAATPGVQVRGPAWPAARGFTLERQRSAASVAADIAWWTPSPLGVVARETWPVGETIVDGSVSPSSQIDGLNLELIAIVLPSDGAPGAAVTVPVDARTPTPLWQPPLRTIAGWCAAVAIGALWLSTRRRAWTGLDGPRLAAVLPAVVFLCLGGSIALSVAPPSLLRLQTTPGGGDYASQFVTLDYLLTELFPRFALYGWFPGHFAGLPLFLMYFPLSFWLAALASVALPATVAFKVTSLVGPALLPAAWWLALRWLATSSAPAAGLTPTTPIAAAAPAAPLGPVAASAAPLLAASGAVVFVLNESQQVWGGNLASVLAGEVAQGLGFPLAWMAVAWTWSRRDEPKSATVAAVLLALATLAHAYAGVAAAAGIALIVFSPRRWWARLVFAMWTALVSIGLLAWWLMPLLWGLPWTTGSPEIWPAGWRQLFPPTTWPFVAAAGVGLARLVFHSATHITRSGWRPRTRHPIDATLALLLVYAAAMWLVAHLAFSLGLVNIRFLPTCLGAVLLAGAWEAGRWIDMLKTPVRAAVLTAAVAAVLVGTVAPMRYLPAWMRWNMHGLELAPGWRDYSRLIARLDARKLESPGRVFYEHSPDHDRLGTPRAFELLPVLARRDTLEGLYLQSALLAPAVLYLQSELSTAPSCAVVSFECGRLNVSTGVEHARLLGADTIVAYSRRVTDDLDAHPEVRRVERVGDYAIYALDDYSLAEGVQHAPVSVPLDDWRHRAHDWLRASRDLDVPMVASGRAPGRTYVDQYRPGKLARQRLEPAPVVRASLSGGEIRISTDRPGHPIIVKVAYHPGWRALDDSPIEIAAPGMLLVTPKSRDTRLVWTTGALGIGAATLSLLSVGLLLWSRVRQIPHWLSASASESWGFDLRRAYGGQVSSAVAPEARLPRWGLLFVTVAAMTVAALSAWAWRRSPPLEASVLMNDGQLALGRKDFTAAEQHFRDLRRARRPMRDDADFYLGLVAAEAGLADVARERWSAFLDEHPVSTFTAEVLVRLGRLDRARGDETTAQARLRAALDAPLAPEEWKDIARAELSAR